MKHPESYKPPKKLQITSDGNILELDRIIPVSKNVKTATYVYKYTKSKTKKGQETEFTEEYITKQLKNYFVEK